MDHNTHPTNLSPDSCIQPGAMQHRADTVVQRARLRNIFRIVIAAVASATAGSLAQAVVAPVAPGRSPEMLPLNGLLIPMTDTIAAVGENIRFAGQASATAQLIDDLQTRAPRVLEIIIDFSGVTATGVISGKAYVTNAQSILHRPAKPFDTIEVSFPYYLSGDLKSARVAMAAFSVSVNAGVLGVTSKLWTPA